MPSMSSMKPVSSMVDNMAAMTLKMARMAAVMATGVSTMASAMTASGVDDNRPSSGGEEQNRREE